MKNTTFKKSFQILEKIVKPSHLFIDRTLTLFGHHLFYPL